MSDVVEKIISGNSYRHGRSVVRVSDGGLYTAGGYTGTVAPMSVALLEANLTDKFAMQDGTDDAITSFATRAQTIGTAAVPLTGLPEGVKLQIKAGDSNSGTIYIGASASMTPGTSDETTGFPLAAGQGTYLPIVQSGVTYAIASQTGQKLFILQV